MTVPWPFSRRGARMSAQAGFQPLQPLDAELFATDDAVIKLWLTEPVTEAIDLISIENDNSRPDVLRSIFFEHLYGSAALIQFTQQRRELEFAQETDAVRFSTRRNTDFETMGKASNDFKLHLPQVMKTDLERLAETQGLSLSLSDYCRRVLVANLFGVRHVEQWKSIG